MDAAFEFQPRIRAVAVDREADLLEAAKLRLVQADNLGFPAALFGVHRVHAVKVVGEERRLLAARAAANLDDDVPLIVRVAREQQNFELLRRLCCRVARFVQLLHRHLAQLLVGLGIVEQHLRTLDIGFRLFQLAVFLHDWRDFLVLLHQRLVLLTIRRHGRIVQF